MDRRFTAGILAPASQVRLLPYQVGAQSPRLGRFRLAQCPRLSGGIAQCAVSLTSRLASRYIVGVLIFATHAAVTFGGL